METKAATTHAANTTGESTKADAYVDRWWHARIWLGYRLSSWLRMLWHNRFAVSPHRVASAVLNTVVAIFHAGLELLQILLYSWRIRRTEIVDAPVFIIGHWRSGTTLLHDLLGRDRRHAFPTTYQCFAPQSFLVTEWWVKRLFAFLMPKRRPMDNVSLGWDRPQEDEFALGALGQPTTYWRVAFPNREQCEEYLDLRGLPEEAISRWKGTFEWFLKTLTFKHGRRIVLKSPPHTARVKHLLELFPEARFIHITRDPVALFPSTLNMWRKMMETHHMQTPRADLEDWVFETLNRMYAAFEDARGDLRGNRYYEVRYEDLVADPGAQLQAIYEQLELGSFEPAREGVDAYLEETADYQPNRFEPDPELADRIYQRWGTYAARYGYGESTK